MAEFTFSGGCREPIGRTSGRQLVANSLHFCCSDAAVIGVTRGKSEERQVGQDIDFLGPETQYAASKGRRIGLKICRRQTRTPALISKGQRDSRKPYRSRLGRVPKIVSIHFDGGHEGHKHSAPPPRRLCETFRQSIVQARSAPRV